MRSLIIGMVLSTDMTRHFEETALLTNKVSNITRTPEEDANVASPRRFGTHMQTGEDRAFFLKLALHTSDVSNPARPPMLMRLWVDRVVNEFYSQVRPPSALLDEFEC